MCAIFQSHKAVYLPNKSPTPLAVNRRGAFEKISESANTKHGATAVKLF